MDRVTVKQGQLQGSVENTVSGLEYFSYKGIPYAAPPIGKLRFKAPLPPLNWQGVRDATNHGDFCPQVEFTSGEIIETSEDCLFLNVYTSNTTHPIAPVMVFLHGGAFLSGSGDSHIYGPDYFVEEGTVLVTINYRLEALGFLCLDSKDVPGNAGMKDQVAALKWIKENIGLFGGDPNNLTLFGESAGGAAVSYHMVSPMSKGLISKAIAQSGCFLNEWATTRNAREKAFKLGAVLGKDTTDPDELLEFLQSLPVNKLVRVSKLVMTAEEKKRSLTLPFVPVVEKFYDGQECFLPKSATELLVDGNFQQIPMILGYTDKEGLLFLRDCLKESEVTNKDFERKVLRSIAEKVTPEESRVIGAKMKRFYFGDKEMGKDTALQTIDMETDRNFSIGIIDLARRLSQYSTEPVYLYRFSADTELNFTKTAFMVSEYEGACHADELFYLFKSGEVEEGSESWKAIKRMVGMWTNFAKYGNPTPKLNEIITESWMPVTNASLNYLEIGNEIKLLQNPDKERFNFWMKIHENINKKKYMKNKL